MQSNINITHIHITHSYDKGIKQHRQTNEIHKFRFSHQVKENIYRLFFGHWKG